MNSPQVGTHVHFYPHGQRNQRPWAAIVTYQGTEGHCKLTLFPANSTPLWSNRLHPHADDPAVDMRLLSRFDGPCPCGTWDFIPLPQNRSTSEPKEDRKEVGMQKVREYAEQGLSPREIAPKVRQYGISTAEVEDEIGATA